MSKAGTDAIRLAREVFEEATARLPAELRSQEDKVVLATTLLNSVATGVSDRQSLNAVAARTIRRFKAAHDGGTSRSRVRMQSTSF